MSKILVIEPRRMLSHALTFALSPEHQVTVVGRIPQPTDVPKHELIVVDAAALRDINALGARELNAARTWRVPTIWIDVNLASPAPDGDSVLRLSWPVDKAELRKAATESLGKVSGSKSKTAAAPKRDSRSPGAAKIESEHPKPPQANSESDRQVIELVDVVE